MTKMHLSRENFYLSEKRSKKSTKIFSHPIMDMNMKCMYFSLSQDIQGKKKGQKGQKKKNTKNKNSQRKSNSKKSNLPLGGNDLSAKLYSTMEKHKEVSRNYLH